MSEVRNMPACIGCGVTPPPSGEDPDSSTLLSMRFGWRVLRRFDSLGGASIEWRCPSCWDRYKAARPTKSKTARRIF